MHACDNASLIYLNMLAWFWPPLADQADRARAAECLPRHGAAVETEDAVGKAPFGHRVLDW
jgi:hypothetical protein